MGYCKFCYNVLIEHVDICPRCNKSQIVKPKRPQKLMGIFPLHVDQYIDEAKKYFYHAEASYECALEATTIEDYLLSWELYKNDCEVIRSYKEVLPSDIFRQFYGVLSKVSEFQWRLRDAIEKSKDSTISDMKHDYRNNINGRATIFSNDIDLATEVADLETANFILSSIYEVARFAKIDIPDLTTQYQNEDLLSEPESELAIIDQMEGYVFEHWCADALENIGFTHVEITPSSGDHGVDVLAQKDGIKYAIQCKRYSSDLGNTPVQEVHAGKDMYRCHVGVVITNQHFTVGAQKLAEVTGTLLWDRDWIIDYLKTQYK